MRALMFCACLAAALPSAAGAQSLSLTEAEALARLTPDGPQTRALLAEVDVVRSDELAAGRWPNPRVTFNRESVAGVTENMVLVTQPLPITGLRGLSVDAAEARTAASRERAGDGIRRLRADLRHAFTAVWLAQSRAGVLTAARQEVAALVDILARREAAGDAAGFDRLRAERESFDLEADQALAETALTRARATLVGLLADPVDQANVSVRRVTRPDAPLPEVDALVDLALRTRGELLALDHDAAAAALAATAAGRRRVPEPEIVAGTKTSSTPGGDTGTVIALQASIPLFDRGGAERARAAAEATRASARADTFRLRLRAEVEALRETVIERRRALQRYQDAVAGSVEVERIARLSYDAGERSILELLDAYRTAAEARLRLAELDAAVRDAEVELEFVSGWEMPS